MLYENLRSYIYTADDLIIIVFQEGLSLVHVWKHPPTTDLQKVCTAWSQIQEAKRYAPNCVVLIIIIHQLSCDLNYNHRFIIIVHYGTVDLSRASATNRLSGIMSRSSRGWPTSTRNANFSNMIQIKLQDYTVSCLLWRQPNAFMMWKIVN